MKTTLAIVLAAAAALASTPAFADATGTVEDDVHHLLQRSAM